MKRKMTRERFVRYAWGVLGYNILVVLWGAVVRATGSGAGCGRHWPLCNGDVVPALAQAATGVEFVHRLMSGLSIGLLVLLVVWAFRAYPRRHLIRRAALVSMFFIVTEALIGAGLVLFGKVAQDQSITRAWSHGAHLVNTFLLLAVLTLTSWWSGGGAPLRMRGQGAVVALLGVALIGTLMLGATGAITALGDTLFPASSVRSGMAQDFSPTAHVLIRLRVIHPILAVTLGVYTIVAGRIIAMLRPTVWTWRFANVLIVLFVVQLLVGALNIQLLVPIGVQLVHLLLADLVWIALVLLGATALAQPASLRNDIPTGSKLIAAARNE